MYVGVLARAPCFRELQGSGGDEVQGLVGYTQGALGHDRRPAPSGGLEGRARCEILFRVFTYAPIRSRSTDHLQVT